MAKCPVKAIDIIAVHLGGTVSRHMDAVRLVEELNGAGFQIMEICERCQIAIRPEGGHLCGSCGRDI